MVFSNYWKKHLQVEKLNLDIFTLAFLPWQNSLKGSYHQPLGRGKLLFPAKERFLENQFHQISRKRGEGQENYGTSKNFMSEETGNDFYPYKFCCNISFNIFWELVSPFQTKCSEEKRKGILTQNELTYLTDLSQQNSP